MADLLRVAVALDMSSLDDIDRAEVIFADGVFFGSHSRAFATDDIALLQLETPAATTPVTIAGQGDDFRFTGRTPATIVGWGLTDGAGAMTDDLLQAEIDLLSADACYGAMGDLYPDATFRPRQHVTRGQMASFLARALDLLALTPSR